MKSKYLCPHCLSEINVNQDIILTGKNSKEKKGLILLHTELGNYSTKRSEDFHIEKGEMVEFFCPICNHNLNYEFKPSYAKLIKEEEGKKNTIIFSRKFGEQSTFKIEGEKIITYGQHALKFTDPEWFLK